MTRTLFDPPLDLLEQRFQTLRDQLGARPEACRPELDTALQELSQAIAALRADRESGGSPQADTPSRCDTILCHLFNAIPDLLIVHDRDFNTIMSNWHGYESLPEAERQGQPKCYRVYHHRDHPCDHCHAPEVLATGQPVRLEKVNPADGRVREISAYPIRDESGRVVLVVEHVRDITERKQAEDVLQTQTRVMESMIEAVTVVSEEGHIVYANQASYTMFGYPEGELIGQPVTVLNDLPSPENERFVRRSIEQLRKKGTWLGEVSNRTKAGTRFTTYARVSTLKQGGKTLWVSVQEDITERKRVEEALRESEGRFRTLIEDSPESLFLTDVQGTILAASREAARRMGKELPEVFGRSAFEHLPPEVASRRRAFFEQVIATGRPVRFEDFKGDMHFDINFTPILDTDGKVSRLSILAIDITDRKNAEQALKESEERFRMLFDHVPDAYILADMQGEIIDCNQAAEDLAGYGREELVGNNFACLPWLDFRQQVRLADLLAQAAWGEVMGPVDFTLTRKDGGEVIAEGMSLPLYIQGQNLVLTIVRDITARKLAEAALRESEARFRHISSTISDISYSCTAGPDGSYTLDWLAGAVQRITGYAVEEIKAQRCWKFLVIEADQPLFEKHITGVAAGACELRLRHKNGGIVWVASFAKLVPDPEQPGLLSLYGGLVDITARKQAEEVLRESERQKSIRNEILQIFLTAPDKDMYSEVLQVILKTMESRFGVFAYQDEHGALVAPSMTRDIWEQCNIPDKTIRFSPETWGDTIWARAIRQKESLWKNEPGLVPEGHVTIENVMVVPLLYRDEVFAHFEVANKKGGYSESDKDWLEGIAQFIAPVLHARLERDRKEAKRQLAEEALAAHLEFLRLLLDTIPNPIFFKDAQGAYLGCNKAFEDFLGVTRQEIVGKSVYDLSPRELAEEYHRMDLAAFQTTGTQVYESRVQAADSTRRHVVFHKATFPDPTGGVGGLVGMITDITELKQAEAELRQSEQRFRLMAETIQDVFWIATPRIGKTLYVSPGFEYIWGRTRDTLYHNPKLFLETVHPEDRERVKTEIIAARERSIPWDHEYRIIRPDGAVRWIHNRGFPVRDDQGRVTLFTGVATDITEHKAMEGQLLQAQKMEAVGRLAGGVAHDFNNLLMAITGYGELMRAKVHQDDPLYSHLENILQAGDRAAALTQQLLTFSRQQVVQPQVIDLNRVVLDLEPMLRRLIGEDLHLEVVTERKPAAVKADPGQMGQIIMNLVVNARDAMPQGGRLTLKTAALEFKKSRYTRFGPAPPGPYVMLVAQDTGVGMDEGTQAHIFEPFFTTKEPGKGTGLGLSTVYGIVKQSGGYLDLISEPGAGSTFTIYLPRLEASVEPPRAKPPITASFQGEETVLLVEDEDMLRGLLAKFLRLYGYTVLEARHGGEALLTCERHPGPIHVMVTDVVMPQMSGRELADRLTPLRPEMKILYMSGYTEDALVQHGVANLSVAFLQKPFRPIELARRVHAVLHPWVSQ